LGYGKRIELWNRVSFWVSIRLSATLRLNGSRKHSLAMSLYGAVNIASLFKIMSVILQLVELVSGQKASAWNSHFGSKWNIEIIDWGAILYTSATGKPLRLNETNNVGRFVKIKLIIRKNHRTKWLNSVHTDGKNILGYPGRIDVFKGFTGSNPTKCWQKFLVL